MNIEHRMFKTLYVISTSGQGNAGCEEKTYTPYKACHVWAYKFSNLPSTVPQRRFEMT